MQISINKYIILHPKIPFFISNIIFINNAKLYVNFKLKQTIVCNKTKIIKNTCCFCWCRRIISQTSTVCCLTI